MKQFKIRCSAINDIAANGRGGGISVGAKTYCKKWVKDNYFNRNTSFFRSKYTDKGNEVEEQAINLIVDVLKLGMVYKNTERKEDDFKTGEIDFLHKGVILDNKSSYSLDTFPIFEDKLDIQYERQMQGYLDLWNVDKGLICYTLIDTPIDILRNELRWLADDDEKQEVALNHLFTEKAFKEAKKNLFPKAKSITFTSIENKHRVKVFEVKRDLEFINDIHLKVIGCQEYITDLIKKL